MTKEHDLGCLISNSEASVSPEQSLIESVDVNILQNAIKLEPVENEDPIEFVSSELQQQHNITTTFQNNSSDPATKQESSISSAASNPEPEKSIPPHSPTNQSKKRFRGDSFSENDVFYEYLDDEKSHQNNKLSQRIEDASYHFGMYVGEKLRSMSPETRNRKEKEIALILFAP